MQKKTPVPLEKRPLKPCAALSAQDQEWGQRSGRVHGSDTRDRRGPTAAPARWQLQYRGASFAFKLHEASGSGWEFGSVLSTSVCPLPSTNWKIRYKTEPRPPVRTFGAEPVGAITPVTSPQTENQALGLHISLSQLPEIPVRDAARTPCSVSLFLTAGHAPMCLPPSRPPFSLSASSFLSPSRFSYRFRHQRRPDIALLNGRKAL